MKAKEFDVLQLAITDGVVAGIARAHKHGTPDENRLVECLEQAVLESICEWFEFNSPAGGD